MKSTMRTIILVTSTILLMGNWGIAQETPAPDTETHKDKAEDFPEVRERAIKKRAERLQAEHLKVQAEQMKKQAKLIKVQAEQMKKQAELIKTDAKHFREQLARSVSLQDRGTGMVLVIPSAEMQAGKIGAIVEDMSVMSRILNNKVGQKVMTFTSFRSYATGSYSTCEPRAIYLQGYGALFLLKVEFPLSPPAKVKEKQSEEPADPIWEQTRRELYEPMNYDFRSQRYPLEEQEQEYDAQKVQDLKNKLCKALKHASNIRHLESEEWITLAIIEDDEPLFLRGHVVLGTSSQSRVVSRTSVQSDVHAQTEPGSAETDQSGANVLIIRVKKSEVDEFAKGELGFDEFQKRVQILSY